MLPELVSNDDKSSEDYIRNNLSAMENDARRSWEKVDVDLRIQYESKARDSLLNGACRELDGLLGDAACQMRALMINLRVLDDDSSTLLRTMCHVFKVLADSDPKKGRVIDEKNVRSKLSLTQKPARELIGNVQRWVSLESVTLLRKCIDGWDKITGVSTCIGSGVILPDELTELKQALNLILKSSEGRSMHLCYPGLKVVLLSTLVNRIPIILHVIRSCGTCHCKHEWQIIFESNGYKLNIVSPTRRTALIGRRALVFKGCSAPEELLIEPDKETGTREAIVEHDEISPACEDSILYLNSLLNDLELISLEAQMVYHLNIGQAGGLVMCILMGSAQHEQVNFKSPVRNPEGACTLLREKGLTGLANELDVINKLAHKYGYCMENPTMFLLKHIYADTIS
jgi:hypothetical protein